MDHDKLVEDALEAIEKVESDTSVDRDRTRESLERLRDSIETALAAL